jgi:hypothetical protein
MLAARPARPTALLALLGVVDEIGVDAPGSPLLYGESSSSDTHQDLVDIIRYART